MIRGLKQSAKEHHPHTHSCNAEMKKMEEDTAGYEKKKKKEKVHTWMSPAENCERILRMWRE